MMARYKPNTKECCFCGKRKHTRFFKKDANYCLSCWRLYFKHLRPESQNEERVNLEKLSHLFKHNHQYRIILHTIYKTQPSMWKEVQACLRHYGKKPKQEWRLITIIETFNAGVSF